MWQRSGCPLDFASHLLGGLVGTVKDARYWIGTEPDPGLA